MICDGYMLFQREVETVMPVGFYSRDNKVPILQL
jgi:hypothetical protein